MSETYLGSQCQEFYWDREENESFSNGLLVEWDIYHSQRVKNIKGITLYCNFLLFIAWVAWLFCGVIFLLLLLHLLEMSQTWVQYNSFRYYVERTGRSVWQYFKIKKRRNTSQFCATSSLLPSTCLNSMLESVFPNTVLNIGIMST